MDLLNALSSRRFSEIDDLLAFIAIYDDARRTRAYRRLLRAHQKFIQNAVCIEGGSGLGIFAAEMARLGARKVYAVEQNPLLAGLAQERFKRLPRLVSQRLELIELPLQDFKPPEKIDVLVHEFYGQLLYDEDLWVLDHLQFKPRLVLPDGGELLAGVIFSRRYVDHILTPALLQSLQGALVSGLFEERRRSLQFPVLRWKFGKGVKTIKQNVAGRPGDLLYFGVAVTHEGKRICEAGRCPNWSYVWTPRQGDHFEFEFRQARRGQDCYFHWR